MLSFRLGTANDLNKHLGTLKVCLVLFLSVLINVLIHVYHVF